MRPRSVALFAACIPLGFCNTNDPASRCAVNCASNIRNDKGALDLKVICGDKLMTNALFQCLITSCSHDAYSPAVAHVILACSDLGTAIGPLYPVEVQHANLIKAQDLLAPSMPAAYSTPSVPSPQSPEQLTLSFDISVEMGCNSGSDGLVTVSLPLPDPPSTTVFPPSPSPAPNSAPSEGEGGGQGDNGGGNDESDGEQNNGGNGNGNGGNGNGEGDCENTNDDNGDGGDGDDGSSPPKPTQASADPSATSSSQPDSASPSAQDPADGQAPSPSTGGDNDGGPAATSAPSASPGGGDPASSASLSLTSPALSFPASPASSPSSAPPASPSSSASPAAPASPSSTSPCPTASPATGGLDPQDPHQSDPSRGSAGEGEGPQVPATSPGLPPAPASSTLADPSTTCSIADGTNVSVDPVPGPQVSQPAQPTSAAQPSPQSSSPAPAPIPSPVPSSSDDTSDPSSAGPPQYSLGSNFETSLPEPSAEPLPQENQSSGAQAPSYGQSALTLRSLTGLSADAAGKTAESQLPSKAPEPSEVTLWPTAKGNRTSRTTSVAGQHGTPTSSCEPDGKQTVTTAHTPRANLVVPSGTPRDASAVVDGQQHESLSSVTVKVIRSGETVAETLLMTVLDTAPLATATPTTTISNESMVGSASSDSPTRSGIATTRATSDITPVQSGEVAKESSAPHVALVNGVSRTTPHLFTIALLIILVGGMLLD
ncbi:hypothetical protein MKX07_008143 [Trichoderma sp. CBMAI-0711]|uniref:Extracellular membrane protein CFEM domain-containing protein n=1 Tax=Trichoderma parareesei TaxID=858221 RepID=A0A2H2ZH49_TRIPA|nr:hypothetical protein MKX07_008143 [Trichoderma sp. CBMAI-0711]OTA01536.1 hypothetical protein A9Z42_0018550 [Trichoderma parareesei]